MIEYKNEGYWKQTLNVDNITTERLDFFLSRFRNKKILHVGCADAGVFDPENNLHIKFINNGMDIDGYDIQKDIINEMGELYKDCDFYTSIDDIDKEYDIVLIPEVLEHVDNPRLFLDEIFKIKSKSFFISVPNCEGLSNNFIYDENNKKAIEFVHPDHYFWFSSYTLYNITKKYIKNPNDVNMFYLQNKSSVSIEINIIQ